MKTDRSISEGRNQPLEPCIAPRVLKVVEIGDFWAKHTMPSIRLQGKWMQRAGILPNRHVRITNPEPGVLLIQLQEVQISDPMAQMHLSKPRDQSYERNEYE